MIKVNYKYQKDYIYKYVSCAIKFYHERFSINGKNVASIELRKNLPLSYFLDFILTKPEEFNYKVKLLVENKSEIIEFYNPILIYGWLYEMICSNEMKINSKSRKSIFNNFFDDVLFQLKQMKNKDERNLILLDYFINLMGCCKGEKESKKKATLKKISVIINRHRPDRDFYTLFPSWILELSEIFDYNNFMNVDIGYDINDKLNISVCPFCNLKNIEPDKKNHGTYRPDLDHFYPKSKYPFFALSLYNLIPSCDECNRANKREEDTYLKNCRHPFLSGLNNKKIYEINNIDDLIIFSNYNDIDGLNIDLSVKINKYKGYENDIFNIEKRVLDKKDKKYHEKAKNIIKMFMRSDKGKCYKIGNEELTEEEYISESCIDLNFDISSLKQVNKKLKVDLVNAIFKRNDVA
ncbi:hypothetical protein [Photobacterium leiognathi]|uniref:hypothetical protein n=1 Tax=Photobacterium leiognathi TaxID=553611 RepID=UPI0029822121|nr:hypothetical protein [Photobacterium leiognathi]